LAAFNFLRLKTPSLKTIFRPDFLPTLLSKNTAGVPNKRKTSCGHPEDLLIYRPQVKPNFRRCPGNGPVVVALAGEVGDGVKTADSEHRHTKLAGIH
jgi:hypothetical protein